MRSHAAADIQQEQYVRRHVFAGKIADRLGPSLLAQDEILGMKVSDGAVRAVDYLRVNTD
jgi:hypothetical protein